MMENIWQTLIFDIKPPRLVTIIGGGGKTSLMYYLLRVLKANGNPVIGTTTTKLSSQHRADHSFVHVQSLVKACQGVEMIRERQESITLVYGEAEHTPGKMVGIPQEWIDELASKYPEVLFVVEGDGSAGMSLKGHLAYEPVIPSRSSLVIVVIGIDSVGSKISAQHVHRPQRICELTRAKPDSLVTMDLITQLLFHPDGYLHTCPQHSLILIFINKVESAMEYKQARELGRQILSRKHPQVCGVLIGSVLKEEGLWLQE